MNGGLESASWALGEWDDDTGDVVSRQYLYKDRHSVEQGLQH